MVLYFSYSHLSSEGNSLQYPSRKDYQPASTPAGHFLAGRQALLSNDVSSAAYHFGFLAEDGQNDNPFVTETFLLKLQSGDIDGAATLAPALVKSGHEGLLAHLSLAVQNLQKHRYQNTLDNLQDLAQRKNRQVAEHELFNLEYFVVPIIRAWAYVGLNNYAAAEQSLQPLKSNKRSKLFYHLHRGLMLAHQDQLDGASQEFEQLMPQLGELPLYFGLRIAQHYVDTKQKDKTDAVLTALQQQHSKLFQHALELQPQKKLSTENMVNQGASDALSASAHALNFPNNADFALVYGQLSLALNPESAFTNILIAEILNKMGRGENAKPYLERVSKYSPFYFQAQLLLAELQDKPDEKIKTLQELAAAFPKAPDTYLNLGDIYRTEERYDDAIAAYTKGLKNFPDPNDKDLWAVYYARGIAEERRQEWQKSEADFQKALELNPNQPYVLNYLGYGWVDRGEHLDKSFKMIEKAVELAPDDAHIIDSLGWAHYKMGNYTQAIVELEKAIALKPADPTINDHLGDAYWQVGRHREARFQWQRARNFDEDRELDHQKLESKIIDGLDATHKS